MTARPLGLCHSMIQPPPPQHPLLTSAARRRSLPLSMRRTPSLLEAAYEISRFLLQEHDLANLLQGVCDRLAGKGLGEAVLLVLVDSASGGVITAETGLQEVFTPLMEGLQEGRLPDCGRRAIAGEDGAVVVCEHCSCGLCNTVAGADGRIGVSVPIRCTPTLVGFLTLRFPADFHPSLVDDSVLIELADTLSMALRQLFAEEAAKQRQRELEMIEERYELALQASQAGLWDWNIRTGEMYTSPDQWELLDYRSDATTPSAPQRFIHPEDRERVLEVLNDHLQGKSEEYRIEYRVREKSGEWTWFLDRGRVVERDENNMPVRMTGTHVNITLQKKQDEAIALVQQQLHEAVNYERNFLQTVIDSAGDPVMVIDLDYNLLLINRAAARLVRTGDEATSLQGEKCYRLFCEAAVPCQDQRFPCPVAAVREQGRQMKLIHNPFHGNGVNNTFELEVSPLKDRQGALYGLIEVARDITDRLRIEKELRESQSHLYRLAHHDTLTGLPNRLLFCDRLDQAANKADRNRSGVAVLFLDLDRFKIVNDTLGHDVGDALLVEVAARLQRLCRQSDTVARLGGDEFVFVLESITDRKDAGVVAAKTMHALTEAIEIGPHRLQISTSIGIALYPEDAASIEEVIKCADQALYAAKEIGRSNFQYYHKDMASANSRPSFNAQQFHRAFAEGAFALDYLPRYALADGRPVGLLAQPWWQHPTMGRLLPDAFVMAAHEHGMLEVLGQWLLTRVAQDVQQWRQAGGLCVQVSIPCDSRLLLEEGILPQLDRFFEDKQLEPSALVLQLRQHVLADATAQLRQRLWKISQIGLGISVSDFGGGGSLPLPEQPLPVQTVLLGREIGWTLDGQVAATTLPAALIAFCHTLNMRVVVDGIEQEAQRLRLVELGCDQGQGPLFSPLLDANQVTTLLIAAPKTAVDDR